MVAQAGDDEAIVRAELDLDQVAAVRRQIPALANVRPDALPPVRAVDVGVIRDAALTTLAACGAARQGAQ